MKLIMTRGIPLVIAVAMVVVTNQSLAAVITNLGTANPSGGLIEQFQGGGTARAQRSSSTDNVHRIFGQTFFAPQLMTFESLALKATNGRDFTGESANLEIKVFDMIAATATDDNGLPDSDNVLLGAFSYDASSLSYGGGEWLQFGFDTPLLLEPGGLYGFLVFWSGATTVSNPFFDVAHSQVNGNQIPGTMRWISTTIHPAGYNAANWNGANPWSGIQTANNTTDADLTFVVFGQVVPEPHTYWLAVCGGLLVLFTVRRRFVFKRRE